jgi:hypothetical protein
MYGARLAPMPFICLSGADRDTFTFNWINQPDAAKSQVYILILELYGIKTCYLYNVHCSINRRHEISLAPTVLLIMSQRTFIRPFNEVLLILGIKKLQITCLILTSCIIVGPEDGLMERPKHVVCLMYT